MTTPINRLLENNRRWATARTGRDTGYFPRRASGPPPKYLFMGCSDLAVPAAGHGKYWRTTNVANLVMNSDTSLLDVRQYVVQDCGIQDIVACDHYGCGGVAGVTSNQQHGCLITG